MPQVSAVLFDYGLVLSGPADPAAWKWLKSTLHADEAEFHAAYWKWRHDYDRGALTAPGYWQRVAKDVGRELAGNDLDDLVDADTRLWTQPNQPMIDWAARLQAARIKTGILSNIGDAMEIGVRARCPWVERFTHLTFSHRLGIAKPELIIYRYAAAGLGVAPEKILFIDDREDNVHAARQAGMQAMLYTSHEAFVQKMREGGFDSLLEPPL